MTSSPEWVIDAPGEWTLDRSHAPGGATPIVQAIMTSSMPLGMRRMFRDLGAPVDTMDVRFVNGFMYTRLRPLIGAERPTSKPPPVALLKLVSRIHPEMRRRTKTAARTLREAPWLGVIDQWRTGGRAEMQRGNLVLQDVALGELDDAAVAAHARRCVDHAIAGWTHHFWLHGFDLGPLGQYLYEGATWSLAPHDLLALLEGSSPSTSEPGRQLVSIRRAVEAAGARPTTLDELRGLSPEIDAAVDSYLRLHGAQLFSRYDLDGLTLGECPGLLLQVILTASSAAQGDKVAAATDEVRERVPLAHRARFDEVLHHARAAMDLRDDNGPNTAEWPLGLVRLALLELGARLTVAGRAAVPIDALELRVDELDHRLFSAAPPHAGAPDPEELAGRRAARYRQARLDPPRTIGRPEVQPALEALPAPLATLVGMVQIVVQQMGMAPEAAHAGTGLHGVGVGTQIVRGTARVAESPEDALDKLEPGDVLVVRSTTPAYNLVMSLAAAVVTSEGGPLSHTAVLGRELNIPVVVGAPGALEMIPDGATVEVDPLAGEVRIVGAV